jgi:putative nucleotidyltransferase with HDIG domain
MGVEATAALPIDQLVKRAGDLEMMPQVARKVIEMVADQNANAVQLADIIEKDANITARILKIANSAFYGLRREVKTVQQAIVILGFKSLRSMVVAASSKALHKRFGITEQLMWDHSIGTAIAGKMLAESYPQVVGELAFVGGLLHNVGKTVMNNECPQAFSEVMKHVYNEGMSPLAAELEVFKYAHPEVGYKVTEKWGLPADLGKIIRSYLISDLTEDEKKPLFTEQNLMLALACVELGSQMCRTLGIGFREKNAKLELQSLESFRILKADTNMLDHWLEKAEAAYKKERAVFN